MRVLVVGTGYVGATLHSLLESYGHDVWGVRRTPKDVNSRIIAADASSGEGLSKLPAEFDQVALCVSPDMRSDEAYQCAYPDVARTMTQHFDKARFVLVSSTSVYPESAGEEITDESPTAGETFAAQRILEAEDIVLSHGANSCVLRASGIYGPGRVRAISQLLRRELSTDERQVWTNRIHRDDLASAVRFLMERSPLQGIFLASDQKPATLEQLSAFVRSHPKRHLLPEVETGTRALGRKSRRMAPNRLQKAGFTFKYPSFQEGYDEIMNALGSS